MSRLYSAAKLSPTRRAGKFALVAIVVLAYPTIHFDVSAQTAPGLVGAWGFNEGSGATVQDSSGNRRTGTVEGATWTTGRYGQALNFDGDDYVTFGDLDLSGPFTVMAWWQTRSLHTNSCGSLVMKALDYGIEICNGRIYAGVGTGTSWTAYPSQALTTGDLNVWRHAALTYDGTTLRFYMGGTLVGSAVGSHASNNNPLLLGRWNPSGEFWNGVIDEVRVHNRALTNAEIQADMASPISDPTVSFQNEVIISGLDLPTNIEFLPDGSMLIGELAGKIKRLPAGSTQLQPTLFLSISNIGTTLGQQGLMDIELDPSFATNGFYYVFYTLGSPNRDRVSRFTANTTRTGTVAGSEFVLWQDPVDANAEHHGGDLSFGPDGKLYVTVGDHFDASVSQVLNSPRGKVLRLNSDGTVPTDNPFYDGAGPNVDAIWARGLRNPYRASFDPVTGRYYIGEVGGNINSTSIEELNLGARGANYGWPICEGSCNQQGMTNPLFSYPHAGRDAAITAGFVYRGSQFPAEYVGSFFYADYTQNWIRRLTFDANGNVTGSHYFEPPDGTADGPYGDIVHLTQGPEGALYYTDLGFSDVGGTFGVSKIRRISYVSAGNLPPVAVAGADPTDGIPPLAVNFSSVGSSDPEGQPLTYFWNFGDGTTATTANPSHIYSASGRYTVVLSVSDGVSTRNAAPLTITVGSPPQATILSPQAGSTFRAGNEIFFSGLGTDSEDGQLPPSAFSWVVNFHHSTHVHPGLPLVGSTDGKLIVPLNGHDFSGDTRYEIRLTVTDSSGLQASSSVFVFPEKVNLTFDSVPSGRTLTLDGISRTTPFAHDTLIGFQHVIGAPNQTTPTSTYTFSSWSDAGAQTHTITVPSAASSYTAVYTASAPPPAVSLFAAWAFDEGAGTTLGDHSGNGRNGTIGGATWVPGKYGQALAFDGNDLVTLGDLDLPGSFTMMGWMQTRSLHSSGCASLLMKALDYGFEICLGTLYAGVGSGNNWTAYLPQPLTTADLNVWKHVALTYDGATLRFYFNGGLVGAGAGTHTSNNNPLLFGRWSSNAEFWDGLIDEVRIYTRALSAEEILSDLNTPVAPAASGQPPVLVNPGAQTRAEGTVVSLQLSASDPDQDPLSFSATGLPPGLTVNPGTGLISGPLDFTTAGIYNATATVTAGGQSDTEAFTWTVANTNRPPSLVNPGDRTNAATASVTLQLLANDTDGDALTYGATGLPPGLSVAPTTGVITGTISASALGNYTVTATVSDIVAVSQVQFVWTVASANTAPSVTVTNPASGASVSGTITVRANASDDVAVLGVQFQIDGTPFGVEDTAAPFEIAWNTLTIANGTHSLSAVARDGSGNHRTSTPVSVVVANTAVGLVGAWAFNAGSGTTLADSSGNGRNGTITGATWTTGRYGLALNFDGNDVVTFTDLDLPGSFTVMAWMQTRSLHPGSCASLVMKALDYGFEICSGLLHAGIGNSGNNWSAYPSAALTSADLNVWKHVALTYDGATLRFYVNGTLVSTAAGAHTTNNQVLRFGRWSSNREFWNGLIDEVRIYSRMLSVSEIQNDMNTPISGP